MTHTKNWTFKELKYQEPTYGIAAFTASRRVLVIVIVATWVIATSVVVQFYNSVDKTTGSHIWSAMELRKTATGNASDDDLEQILHFVLSDMSGLWTYRELKQHGNVLRMDTSLWYHPDRGQPGRFDYNLQLQKTLPDRMDRHASKSWWGTSQNTGASSCICGSAGVNLMQIFYNEDSAMSRVAVIAHEYYHVLQMHYCPTVYDDRTHFVMWLSEGAATVMQNLYITHWLSGHSLYHDFLFDAQYGHVKQMIDKVQSGEYTYHAALNTHDGAHNNYIASTTALLYLMYRKGASSYLQYMLVDFLFSGDCDLAANGGMNAGFQNAFGKWETVDAFYADLNAFLGSATADSINLLRPTAPSIARLFNHTSLCSDVCELSRNGVCDSECPYGSDCTDCGATPMPNTWPVRLRYEWRAPDESPLRAFYSVF